MVDYMNRTIQIMLDLANLADQKKETPFESDMGLGYRSFSGYIRKGVQEMITLQNEYYSVCESRDWANSSKESAEELLVKIFGTKEVTEYNEEEIAKIKAVVSEIEKSYDDED